MARDPSRRAVRSTWCSNASSGEVTIDDAAHKEALDFYVSLLPYAPAGAAQLDWAGARNLFYQGNLAMMRFWVTPTADPGRLARQRRHRGRPDDRGPGRHRGCAGSLVPVGAGIRFEERGRPRSSSSSPTTTTICRRTPRSVSWLARARSRARTASPDTRTTRPCSRRSRRRRRCPVRRQRAVAGDHRFGAHSAPAEGRRTGCRYRGAPLGGQDTDRADHPVVPASGRNRARTHRCTHEPREGWRPSPSRGSDRPAARTVDRRPCRAAAGRVG